MTGNSDFPTPPPQEAPGGRLPLVLEGNPGWTTTNLSFGATRPGGSSVNVGWVDKTTAATRLMPLTPSQARQAGMELIIRADLIDPAGGA